MDYFFAPNDSNIYPPAGMFTWPHILMAIFCFIMVAILVFVTKKISKQTLHKVTRVVSIILVILEIIKIAYNFYYGYTWVDAWLPFAFCSLFIYSMILAGFAKQPLRKLATSFLVGAGIISGAAFLIFPTTSLMLHPIFHYLSLYSMFFHSCMLYFGIMYLIKGVFVPSLKNYQYYVAYAGSFCLVAIIINLFYQSNLMFLRAPYNFPIELVNKLYEHSHFCYTLLILAAYILMYFVILVVYKIFSKKKI